PLNAMLGWISQLNRNTVDEAGRTRALAALERSARLQWRLVNELLDSASIAQGSLRVEKAPVDLQNVALAAIESVRSEADRREIQIVLEAQSVRVIGDATRLQQVITNLINNAVQFTPAGGRVLVTIETSDDDAVIAVQDTGIGIEADFLPHVFDRFKQGPGGSRDGHSGLGLGLAIARHIVELHGGTIVAESAGVGRGAVFTIHLPLSDRRAPAAPAGRNASADV
ncbi:MAG TPA: HAMP domain-containing sensor histidine kinase, partial [Nitrospirales bacterium]|nr:HAMP domain-containing sensor histidine kinase [Nitrospirales bacterium]